MTMMLAPSKAILAGEKGDAREPSAEAEAEAKAEAGGGETDGGQPAQRRSRRESNGADGRPEQIAAQSS